VHPLLRKQLGRPAAGSIPAAELQRLLGQIDATYREHDEDRRRLLAAIETLSGVMGSMAGAAQAEPEEAASAAAAAKSRKPKGPRLRLDVPQPVLELNAGLEVRRINRAAAVLFGCTREAAKGQAVLSLLEPLDRAQLEAQWQEKLGRGEPVLETVACNARDGRAQAVRWALFPLLRAGRLTRVLGLLQDETRRVEAAERTRRREQSLLEAVSSSGDGAFEWNVVRNEFELWSGGQLQLPGGAQRGKLSDWFAMAHPDDLPVLRAALMAHVDGKEPHFTCEHRLKQADGRWVWYSARGDATRDASGAAVKVSGILAQVDLLRRLIEKMAHDARHDPLTGLANRTLFMDLVDHSFSRIRRHPEYRFALVFIDIDGFKQVNDTLGHAAGDDLLVEIARRLSGCLREGDRLARYAGDEFTMWLDDVRSTDEARRIGSRVHESMARPFELTAGTINSSASVGIAFASTGYADAAAVLREADRAMYEAKAKGPGHTVVHETGPQPQVKARTGAEALRRAVEGGELRVVYQPIVDLPSGRINAFEALARWQHPQLGLVPPSQFLADAAEAKLIGSIDQWMLDSAARQLVAWKGAVPQAAKLKLSVNLSQQTLQDPQLARVLAGKLKQAGARGDDFVIDIPESALTGASLQLPLAELLATGVRLHLDDFGAGPNWLDSLYVEQVESVKLDRRCSAPGGSGPKALGRLVKLARELGKRVIAEGVETQEQLVLVREAGCHSAQGYLFGEPVEAAKAAELLRSTLPA
jgi:diguanylate cyclase (GGDEF)-like protein/PAS domain S-box-containing protein